jgi:hypothetical protein
LMGEKAFGKGLIQAVYGLDNGAGLILTVATYLTPPEVLLLLAVLGTDTGYQRTSSGATSETM